MKVLHCVAPAQVGGLERVVQALAVGQRGAGIDARVAAVVDRAHADGHPLLHSLEGARVPVTRIVLPPRAYLAERARVRALCREMCPSVVHTHGYRPDVLDAGVARRLGIPVVTTVHGFTRGGWKNRLYEHLQRRAFRRFDAVVAVSRALADTLVTGGTPGDRVHVILNAWSGEAPLADRAVARRELGMPADGFGIGWVGRLSHEKGADVLLDALARLSDLPCRVCFVGDGVEREPLERHAARLGVAHRTAWRGLVPGAGRLLRAFDVFVQSSRAEGMPMALFEAMAAEVPIVATAVGGVPDVLSADEAILVPPNDPAALAAGIRHVVADPAGAAARAGAARARLERDFAPARWLERYAALYRRLVVLGEGE